VRLTVMDEAKGWQQGWRSEWTVQFWGRNRG